MFPGSVHVCCVVVVVTVMVTGAPCFLCSSPTSDHCRSCKIPTCSDYCRGKHLYQGDVCLPFRVENSEALGRHVIATRDILPTELIISGNMLTF